MSGTSPPPEFLERLARLLGVAVLDARTVRRGYTQAERCVARLADGTSVFAKGAVDALTGQWLRTERRAYEALALPCQARVRAWEEDPAPLLVLEDLSGAHWPPPWRPGDVETVREALVRLHAAPVPDGLPSAEAQRVHLDGWPSLAEDPSAFLATGLVEPAWFSRALPTLRAASRAAVLEGGSALHFDVRSDNVALDAGRAVLVDWNWICVGNPDLDLAGWLPSLASEGGPRPETLWRAGPELPALVAGYFASVVGRPPPHAGSTLRELQRRQLLTALPWAARALGLDPPWPA